MSTSTVLPYNVWKVEKVFDMWAGFVLQKLMLNGTVTLEEMDYLEHICTFRWVSLIHGQAVHTD